MGLKILITEEQLEIPKMGIKTHFIPPSDAQNRIARQTLFWLKDSPYLQVKSKNEDRKEVLQILKNYGKSLFCCILPPRLNIAFDISQSLELKIDFLLWENIAWELLHNGNNWLALEGGVKRIHSGKAKMRYPSAKQIANWQFFSSHNHFLSPNFETNHQTPSFEFYYSPHDWFIENKFNLQENIQWNIFLNGTLENFRFIFKTNPRYLFLQGFLDITQMLFFSKNEDRVQKNILDFPFIDAIEKGLELLVVNFKQIKDLKDGSHCVLLEKFFDLGIPSLINFSGSIHRKNIRTYMSCLIVQIAQGKNIFASHLHALKQMSQTLSYSWDWLWIQFWENDKFIAPQKANAIIDYQQNSLMNKKYFSRQKFWYLRKFYGNTQTLLNLKEKIVNLFSGSKNNLAENILWIQDDLLQNAGNYLHRFAMEYYQDYQYIQISIRGDNLKYSANQTQNSNKNNSLEKYIEQAKNLLFPTKMNFSIWDTIYRLEEKLEPQMKNLLFIFLLSGDLSPSFIKWLSKKKEFKIIIVVHEKKEPSFRETPYKLNRIFALNSLNWDEVLNFFDYPTRKAIQKSLPSNAQLNSLALSYRLVKLVYLAKNLSAKNLWQSLGQSSDISQEESVWKQIIDNLPQQLSPLAQQILLICYLFTSFIPVKFLEDLLGIKDLDSYLEKLYHCHLLEKSLDQKQISLESGFCFLLTKYAFFEQKKLQHTRTFLLKFFTKKETFEMYQSTFSYYIFSNLDDILEIEDKNISYQYLKDIFAFLKWDSKKIFYYKIFEKIAHFSEKRTLLWLCSFYQESLFYQKNSESVVKLQEINEFLEIKEEWELLFYNHLILANYFLIKENHQKARVFLAPVIELLKEKTSSFQNISDVAFLLIGLDDTNTLKSLLEHFPFYSASQKHGKCELENSYIKAYQCYKQGDEKTALAVLCSKIELSTIDITRYYKIYAIYITLCSKFQRIVELKKFLEKINFEENCLYYPYKLLISTLFNVALQNKLLFRQKEKIDEGFVDLLEKYYRIAQKNKDKDKKVFTYADLLGKLHYEMGNKKKYKFYLEEYYEEINDLPK